MDTTVDGLLNRRVQLEQPRRGYRVALDTVFLAASVPARSGDFILDLGCGVGGAMLCLAGRVPDITGGGVDSQEDLILLAQANIERNSFAKGLFAKVCDATKLPEEFRGKSDCVLMNPPYHEELRHDVSPNAVKKTANTEKDGDLRRWIHAASESLREGGSVTLVHRADRADEILEALCKTFGAVEARELLPHEGALAKRMLVRAQKGAVWTLKKAAPFVLHTSGGSYTSEAEAILREGRSIAFDSCL